MSEMEITRIPPKKEQRKMRVAAYARVSTLSEEQEESFETQMNYYTALIHRNSKWSFAGMYADRGRSGLSAQKRPDFLRMIRDAMNGKIDIILVKSISRFCRNSLEAQKYVHKLKEKNIEVRFEREGISSFDIQMDLIFNFMTAVAEQESKSISNNVRWSYEKLARQGIRHIGNHRMLGYDEKNGTLVPNEDAWIPKLIFEEYAKGTSLAEISGKIAERGGKRLRSKKNFDPNVLLSILQNEIYVGDHRIQKASHTDMKTKRPVKGESYESFYVTDDHEGVISRGIWQKVQDKLKKEEEYRQKGLYHRRSSCFLYGLLFCGECGEPMVRKTAIVKNEQKKYWICRDRKKGAKGKGCRNATIGEVEILEILGKELGIDANKLSREDFAGIEGVKVYKDKTITILR